MSVAAILKEKGGSVTTAGTNDTLASVSKLLAEKKIGAVLVVGADEKIAGIVSERDIVRALAEWGSEALSSPVSKVMTTAVVTCEPEDSIISVMGQMTAGRFRHVPVVSEGKLIGIVSIGDVVKRRIAEAEREAEEMRAYITAG